MTLTPESQDLSTLPQDLSAGAPPATIESLAISFPFEEALTNMDF